MYIVRKRSRFNFAFANLLSLRIFVIEMFTERQGEFYFNQTVNEQKKKRKGSFGEINFDEIKLEIGTGQ